MYCPNPRKKYGNRDRASPIDDCRQSINVLKGEGYPAREQAGSSEVLMVLMISVIGGLLFDEARTQQINDAMQR